MPSQILVVFENEAVFPEALVYAREFAMRIDARVAMLMLVPMAFAGRDFLGPKRVAYQKIESRTGRILSECAQSFIQQGLEVSSALKIGDPAQELIKFLMDRPPFQAVIWGSGQDLPSKGRTSRHWITRVANSLDCPLLTVSKKETG